MTLELDMAALQLLPAEENALDPGCRLSCLYDTCYVTCFLSCIVTNN